MTQKIRICLVLIASILLVPTSAWAANVETPLPANTYITKDGVDWVWAYPYNSGHGDFDLSYQAQFGWRIPTAEELANAPQATEFIFPGANVPLGGSDPVSGASFHVTNALLDGDAACATPYFSSGSWNHCDWADATDYPWYGLPDADQWGEQLLIRGEVQHRPVPSMTAWGLLSLGVLVIGFAVVRLKKA